MLLCALIGIVCVSVGAKEYRILFLNTATISIGGKDLKKGDTFDDRDIIAWQKTDQAMKVVEVESGKVHVVAAKTMRSTQSKSLLDYIGSYIKLSSRNPDDGTVMNGEYMLDSLVIDVLDNPDVERYVMEYTLQGKKYNCELTRLDATHIVILRSDFAESWAEPLTLDIRCVRKDNPNEEIMISGLVLLPLPLRLD